MSCPVGVVVVLAEPVVAVVVGERWSLSGRCSTSVHRSWAVVDTTGPWHHGMRRCWCCLLR